MLLKSHTHISKIKLLFLFLCLSTSFISGQTKSYVNFSDYVIEDDSTYTYSMIKEDLNFFSNRFPNWVHAEVSGKSEFGLELNLIRIGTGLEKKNCLFFVGNIHAREDYSSKFLMKFTNVLLLNLSGQDSTYLGFSQLLDSVDLYIMPVANPDGLKIAQYDLVGIQDSFNLYKDSITLVETFAEWKANGKGIDINTSFDDGNHGVKKGETFHISPASEGYKGNFPAEPKETQFLQDFISNKQPLFTASFHTKGNVIFWADIKTHVYFNGIDTEINLLATECSDFKVAKVATDPSNYGCGLENFVRARYGLLASCIELSSPEKSRKQYADNLFNQQVWNLAWKIPYVYVVSVVKNASELRKISLQYQSQTH